DAAANGLDWGYVATFFGLCRVGFPIPPVLIIKEFVENLALTFRNNRTFRKSLTHELARRTYEALEVFLIFCSKYPTGKRVPPRTAPARSRKWPMLRSNPHPIQGKR